jgi:hypothetical protein
MGNAPGIHCHGNQPAELKRVVFAASEKYHSPRSRTRLAVGS